MLMGMLATVIIIAAVLCLPPIKGE